MTSYNPAAFKPGDVAMVTTWGGERRAWLSQNRNWNWGGGIAAESAVHEARPLVVLDPDSDEDVERLRREYDRAITAATTSDDGTYVAFLHSAKQRTDAMRAALRSLTRPPKPDEPTGRAAVVVDRKGRAWARVDSNSLPWRQCGGDGRYRAWDSLDVPPDGVKFGGVS